MKHVDPGITLEYMFEVYTQDNIVTEQQDLCPGVPFVQPFCPCDKENGFPGAGNPINYPVAFTDLPGIVLLLPVQNDESKTLLGIYFGQGFRWQVTENYFRMNNGTENIDLFGGEGGDLPVRIKKPHQGISYLIGGCIFKINQFVPEQCIISLENFRNVLVLSP
jgi:hypothetical protein